MKLIVFTTAVLLSTTLLQGQNGNKEPQTQYIFGGHDSKITGFGGFSSQFGMARGKYAQYSGGGGAVLIDYKFFVGGFGSGLSGELKFDDIYTENNTIKYDQLRASMGIGGLWMGYSFNHQKPIHFAASVKVGPGAITVYPKKFNHDEMTAVYTDIIAMVEPELMVEFNLFRWWRMQVGASYRYVFNIDSDTYRNAQGEQVRYFKNNDFNTPTVGFNMIFGVFGPRASNN
jgi:hypothetical protein